MNTELIKALRCKEYFDLCNVENCCYHLTNTKSGCKCAIKLMATDAAAALEAAEKRIAELEQSKHELERLQAAIKVKGGDEHYPTEFAYLAVCKANEDKRVRIAELKAAQGWIPVKERLPDDVGSYLVYYHEWSNGDFLPKYDDYRIRVMRFMNNGKWRMPVCTDKRCEADTNRDVTHWQPLPQPPQKGE